LLTERIPVSEIEDVEIALVDAGPFSHDTNDGFLKTSVDIGPQATKTVTYSYEVRAGARVTLPAF
jgi:predicted RNA-binding protein with EMAP domain